MMAGNMLAATKNSSAVEAPLQIAAMPLSSKLRVVLVDDDPDYLEAICGELEDLDISARGFVSGEGILAWMGGNPADILVLDWNLPGKPGIELLAELRAAGFRLPAVFLTGQCTSRFEGIAFDCGAVDFIDKTRGVSILAKRLRLISLPLPVASPPVEEVGQWGPLTLKLRTSRAFWKGFDVGLTLGEYKIVKYLLSRPEAPSTYREIYDCLRYVGFAAGYGEDGFRTNVRSAVKRIRRKFQKIDPAFDSILNHTGSGYSWLGT